MQSEGKSGSRILHLFKTLSLTKCLQKYASYSEGSGDRLIHVVRVRLDHAVLMNGSQATGLCGVKTCFSHQVQSPLEGNHHRLSSPHGMFCVHMAPKAAW